MSTTTLPTRPFTNTTLKLAHIEAYLDTLNDDEPASEGRPTDVCLVATAIKAYGYTLKYGCGYHDTMTDHGLITFAPTIAPLIAWHDTYTLGDTIPDPTHPRYEGAGEHGKRPTVATTRAAIAWVRKKYPELVKLENS